MQAAEQIIWSYLDMPKKIKIITGCKDNRLKRLNIVKRVIGDWGKTYFYKVFLCLLTLR